MARDDEALTLREQLDETRDALARAQCLAAVGQVSAGLAHDLRNALGGLALHLRAVQDDAVCSKAQAKNLGVIERVLQESLQALGRLQDAARPSQPGAHETAALPEVVADAAALVGRGLRLETKLPPRLPRVRGSPAELTHVFLNLLLNARDAMPRKGCVRIAASARGRHVVVTVSDEGPGIPAASRARVFEPFFTTKNQRGLGMGLWVARRAMEATGGSLVLEPGRGAKFSLKFVRA